jgi:16S rRNA (guanine966-N2)-methyltransferase
MRIIAGTLKGRKLTPPKDESSRPTADRAREALFSILTSRGALTEGMHVLDCFAGTGALGLEALSRGAAHASFIELQPDAVSVIRSNVYALGVEKIATILKADAVKPPKADAPCDLVFLDPPYGKELVSPCLIALSRAGWVVPGTTVVVEIAKDESIELPFGFAIEDERRYGAARILILSVDR